MKGDIRVKRLSKNLFNVRMGDYDEVTGVSNYIMTRDQLNDLYTEMMRALNEEEPDEPDRQAAPVSV